MKKESKKNPMARLILHNLKRRTLGISGNSTFNNTLRCVSNLKILYGTLMIVVGLLITSNNAFCAIGGTGYTIYCDVCNCEESCLCAEIDDITTFGHARIVIGDPSPDIIMSNDLVHFSNATFFIHDSLQDNNQHGTGYIGIQIYLDKITQMYYLDTAGCVKYTIHTDWLNAKNYIEDTTNYLDNKVLVFPNPTNSTAYVKLLDSFMSDNNIDSCTISIYRDEILAAVLTSGNVNANGIIPIYESIISTNGTYYVVCYISYTDSSGACQSDIVTVPFVVIK